MVLIRETFKKPSGTPPTDSTYNDKQDDALFYCHYQGSTELKNEGWYYDEFTKIWTPLGNMTINLTEII